MADRALYLAKPESRSGINRDQGDDPYLRRPRRDGPRAPRPARSDAAARDDPDPGDGPARDPARLHLPGRTGRADPDRQPRQRPVRGDASAIGCRSRRASAGRSTGRAQPLSVPDYDAFAGRSAGLPNATFGSVLGVPLASGGTTVGRHRARVRHHGSVVRSARDACPGPLRPAGVDRSGQLAAVRRGPARCPPRRHDRPPEPRPADRPDRRHPGRDEGRSRGVGRGHPARPRSVQGHQRERRPRGRRPAPARPSASDWSSRFARPTWSPVSGATSSRSSSTRSTTPTRLAASPSASAASCERPSR